MDDLNIILPVHNEKKTIKIVLKEWKRELEKHKIKYHFIICEDGSTDGTKDVLKKIKKKHNLILNQKQKRRGYGEAVIAGIKSAHSKYILCVDSDGQCDPKDFIKFWVNKDKANVLIGWRTKRADSPQRKLFSLMFKIVFKLLFPTPIHDPSCPYVLFKKQTILPYLKYLKYLKEGFWWGFVGVCVKKKLTLYEISISHRKRLKGETVVYKFNKIPLIALINLWGLIKLKRS